MTVGASGAFPLAFLAAFDPGDRSKWAAGMNIPTVAELFARHETPEVVYWVGCMGSFDDRAKKTTVAFARILQAAGHKIAIVAEEDFLEAIGGESEGIRQRFTLAQLTRLLKISRDRLRSPRKNGANAWRLSSGDMPMPLSSTRSS